MANGRDVTFRSCLSHQAGAFRGNAVQKMRNESTRENHTQRLKVSCLSATVEKCEVGGSHKLAECSKNLWKETTKSLRDMRIHFGYEMPHDTTWKQIICMWGEGGWPFLYNRWLKNFWNKCLHIKPLFETLWKRKSRVSKDFFLCDFRADAWVWACPFCSITHSPPCHEGLVHYSPSFTYAQSGMYSCIWT